MLRECINEIINNYGQDIEIVTDGTTLKKGKAFIQSLNTKNNVKTFSSLGNIEKNSYLYIGPKDINLDFYENETVIIKTKNDNYILKKVEKKYINNTVIYTSAILSRCIAED